jgi:hypothetical protein
LPVPGGILKAVAGGRLPVPGGMSRTAALATCNQQLATGIRQLATSR